MTELIDFLTTKKEILKTLIYLSLLLGFFFIICSLIPKRKYRFILSFISAFFCCLQLISIYFTQTFIGYKFYSHLNLRGIAGISGLFTPHLIFICIILVLITLLNFSSFNLLKKDYFFSKKIKINQSLRKPIFLITANVFLFTVLLKSSLVYDSKSLFIIFSKTTLNFENVLHKNKMQNYISPKKIKSKSGKNIIVLSLESLEKAYLSEKYKNLTPNLNNLKKKWNYFELKQNNGSDWTSGSIYTSLTGFPAFFGVYGNRIFQTAYYSKVSSISHVLEKANYNTVYLNGNTDFSGVKEMLNTFEFDKIIDHKSILKNLDLSEYGIRDKDLFDLAKNEILDYKKNNSPFAVFLSTTDTHFPNGIYDHRMEAFVSSKSTNLEFMVAAVDYMIGDFISFLESENLLNNTSIYIFPDHLKMGNPSIFEGTGERGLYFLTNSNNYDKTDSVLYQIDIPKLILEGAEIEHNLKFLCEYIKGDKNKFIEENILELTEINTSGILRLDSKPFEIGTISKNYETYKKDTLRFIAHAGGKIENNIYTNCKEALDLSYKKGFRLFELDILKTTDNKFVAAHDWEHWAEITGYKGSYPVSNNIFNEYKIYDKYTSLDMNAINEWFLKHPDAILITDKINSPAAFSKEFIDPNRLMMELFDMNSIKEAVNSKILSAIPSENIISSIDKSDIKYLADLGIKHIAISRTFIEKNKDKLLEFKKYNIKPYVFHINYAPGIDEDYVLKYEMEYIYGMYADSWNF